MEKGESTPLLGKRPTKEGNLKKRMERKSPNTPQPPLNAIPGFGFVQNSADEMEMIKRRITGREKRPHPRRFRSLPHAAPIKPRYVTSVCTAKEYNMAELKHYFESRHFPVIDSTEVLYTRYTTTTPAPGSTTGATTPSPGHAEGATEGYGASSNSPTVSDLEVAEVFFFQYGVVVWWGPSDSWGKLMVLSLLKKFEVKPEESLDLEVCDYSYAMDYSPHSGDKMGTDSEEVEEADQQPLSPWAAYVANLDPTKSTIANDHFILASRDWEVKLAFSHGLAQSAKLTVFEERIDQVIEVTRKYPEFLAEHGKVELTRQEIAMLKGKLFMHRMDVNLHSDILDTPDYFWEHTDLEPLYYQCRKNMEIDKRVEILNQRLDVVHELFTMLSDELNQKHSSKLEWIIIWLILIEVIVGILSIGMGLASH
eukprot:RCo034409